MPSDAIIEAAARLLAAQGIARVSRRDVAKAVGTSSRMVRRIAANRSDLLRLVLLQLPLPPIPESLRRRTQRPGEPAMAALLAAARQTLGSPAAAWDTREIQAIALARYDDALGEVVRDRLRTRREGALALVRELRAQGGVDASIQDDAAALHLMSVGLGLSAIAGTGAWPAPQGWDALTARLVEALAAVDPPLVEPPDRTVTWRARVSIANSPSALARLLRAIAGLKVMVMSSFTVVSGSQEQVVDLILRAPADLERQAITHALSSVATDVLVARGAADDIEDVATRVLDRAAWLVEDPEAAPQAVADLVLADSYEVTPASEGADASDDVMRVQWTLDRHVVLRRRGAPFTRVELNRASALLGLVAALAEMRGTESGYGWQDTLSDGTEVWIRLARPQDAQGVAAMHERCSERSRYHRYFTPMNSWREANLRRVSGGHRGATLVATTGAGEVIALGNVFPIGPQDDSGAEIAVIVDDAFHGRGLGAAVMRRLVDVAARLGFASVTAYVLSDNRAMLGLLESMPLPWSPVAEHDLGPSVVALTAPIAPAT